MKHTKNAYILEISRLGSISKAAKQLYVSQPYLSRVLREIEDELGVLLFNRSSSPLVLTAAGERYIEFIKDAQALEYAMRYDIDQLKKSSDPSFVIGVQPVASMTIMSVILPRFLALYPDLSIKLEEMLAPEIRSAVLSKRIDLGLINTYSTPKSLKQEICSTEPMLLAIPDLDNKLNIESSTSKEILHFPSNKYSLLGNYRFILLEESTDFGGFARKFLSENGISYENAITINSLNTALTLASNGVGATLVVPTITGSPLQNKNLTYYTFGEPKYTSSIFFTYLPDKVLSTYERSFIDIVKNYYATPPPTML